MIFSTIVCIGIHVPCKLQRTHASKAQFSSNQVPVLVSTLAAAERHYECILSFIDPVASQILKVQTM